MGGGSHLEQEKKWPTSPEQMTFHGFSQPKFPLEDTAATDSLKDPGEGEKWKRNPIIATTLLYSGLNHHSGRI